MENTIMQLTTTIIVLAFLGLVLWGSMLAAGKLHQKVELHERPSQEQKPPKKIRLTKENLSYFPKFQRLYEKKEIVFDKTGRLRYPHGAPVGDLRLVRVNKDGKAIYRETASGWFGPDSPRAKAFKWPEEEPKEAPKEAPEEDPKKP